MNGRVLWVAVFVAYFTLILAPAAQAYLDPGSGSFIFQAIIGGLLAGAVAVKTFGQRIWTFVRGRGGRRDTEERTSEKLG